MKSILSISLLLISLSAYGQMERPVSSVLPDIISRFPAVRDFTISATGQEAWFTAQSFMEEVSVIMYIAKQGETWKSPVIAPFSGKYHDMEPFLSPDGRRLYFASNRPLDQTGFKGKDYDIWYVERESVATPWSEPINPGAPINTTKNEFYPSVARNGNLYLTSDGPEAKGNDDIFLCAFVDGKYQAPVSLSDSINSVGYEFNAFVAPDESYLLFTGYQRKGGVGSGDLYISYRQPDGTWGNATNLGTEINSDKMDYCPFVDAGTGFLYFTSKRSGVRDMHPRYEGTKAMLEEMNRYDNGQSRIYEARFPRR